MNRIAGNIVEEAVVIRHYLHQNPEISGQEKNTSNYIKACLEKYPPDELVSFDNLGFLATYGNSEGQKTMIRGDFDALPIHEVGFQPYRSMVDGVSHMCGHDGHTAILLGLAMHLHNQPPQKGTIGLLFQPSEENGAGAKGIMADPKFVFKPDQVIALHNIPGYALNEVIVKKGSFTPAVTSIILKLKGKTAHAAQPEKGINPASALSKITATYLGTARPDLNSDFYRIITPIYFNLGTKDHGISADEAEMHFTIRAWTNQVLTNYISELSEAAKTIAKEESLHLDIEFTQSFFSNQNDEKVVDRIVEATNKLELACTLTTHPFTWGEDFGVFTSHFKGAMFGIGAGENCPSLHNPDYDFPDEIIETAIELFLQIHEEL
ncbi:MAG: amidohydrolase [Cyclobacteriaceae bacterium]